MQDHLRKQYRRYELAWYDLYHADNIARQIVEQELYDDARVKRSTKRLALHTALVVTYARPFTEAEGFVGLPSGVLDALDSDEQELHQALIDLRNKVYAHTDSEFFSIKMETTPENDLRATTSSPRLFHFGMPKDVLRDLTRAIQKLKKEVRQRQEDLENKLEA